MPFDSSPRGVESILLVEDEAVVRALVSSVLTKQGYVVVEAACAVDALAICDDNESFDLLVTDVVMPGMNGHDLAAQLIPRFPSLRVLFTSGYSSHTIAVGGTLEPGRAFLQKPFAIGELASTVRDLLDGPPVGNPLVAA